jgi:geranylgeranyl diphosphate synthase type II
MQPWTETLKEKQRLVEDFLATRFTQSADYGVLLEAMRYSLLAGGKRLRPVLVLAFCEAVGGCQDTVLPAAGAVEMVHTYSLIHDDLPCMDNDDYRRGRLTCHKVYGEDIATLAGDALLTAAFGTLTETQAPADRVLRCVGILAQAAGEHGMVAGQILDLEGEKRSLTEIELRQVHRHKTGDMIRAACQVGTVLGGGTEEQIVAAGAFAEGLGMAFQIRDDLLDCIGTQADLGKPIGSDQENGKSTFVTLFGLEACQKLVEQETQGALSHLAGHGFSNTDFLRDLALALTARKK